MKRVFLFIITNLAIILILSIVLRLLGVDRILDEQGAGLDLANLLVFAAVFGFGGAFISLAMSKWTAKRLTGAQVIESAKNEVEAWLLNTIKRQATAAGIGMPEVAIYDAPDAHVANGDMVTLALIQGVVNTFVIFLSRVVGYFVDRVVFKTERGTGPAFFITTIVAQIVFGILASVIVMWFSRQREFRADAGSAAIEGRQKMISALRRLQKTVEQPHLPDQMAAFGISGERHSGIRKLFMTHPPLEERIAALEAAE